MVDWMAQCLALKKVGKMGALLVQRLVYLWVDLKDGPRVVTMVAGWVGLMVAQSEAVTVCQLVVHLADRRELVRAWCSVDLKAKLLVDRSAVQLVAMLACLKVTTMGGCWVAQMASEMVG